MTEEEYVRGARAADMLGISPETFFSQFVNRGKIERFRGRVKGGLDGFKVSDVHRLIRERAGVLDEKKPPIAFHDAQQFSIRDAAMMLNMPIHHARDAMAAWGCRIEMNAVSDMIEKRHIIANLGRAVADAAARIKVRDAVTEKTPAKPEQNFITIDNKRYFQLSVIAQQCGCDPNIATRAVKELSLEPLAIGGTKLLNDANSESVRTWVKAYKEKAASVAHTRPVSDSSMAALVAEQKRTNELLERLVRVNEQLAAAWAK